MASLVNYREPVRPYKDRYLSANNPYVQIDRLYYQGKFSEAASMYEREIARAFTDRQKILAYHGLAWSYIGLGRFLEAIDYFERASVLVRNPDESLENKLGIAFARYFRGDYQKALQVLQLARMYQTAPADGRAALEFLEAAIYWELGDRRKAEERILDAFRKFPGTFYAQKGLLALARAYMESGAYDKAVEYLDMVLRKATDRDIVAQASTLLYDYYIKAGKVDSAISVLTEVIKNSSDEELKRWAEAQIAHLSEEYRSRLITNDELLKSSRIAAVYVLYNPGVRAYSAQDYLTAKPLLEKFVKFHPEDTLAARAAVALAKIYIEEGNHSKALDILNTVDMDRLPADVRNDAFYFYAISALALGDYANAARYLSRLSRDPEYGKLAQEKLTKLVMAHPEYAEYLPEDNPAYNYARAMDALKRGDTLSAIAYLEKYLQGNPSGKEDLLLTLIDLSYKKKDYSRTLKYSRTYLESGYTSKKDIILFLAGASAYQMGYPGEALQYWDRLLYEFPGSPMAEKALAFARQLLSEKPELFALDIKSPALLKVKKYSQIYDLYKRKDYTKVLQMLEGDTSPEALRLKGLAYLGLKEYDKAYRFLSMVDETPEIAFFKGEALLGMKKYRQAYRMYRKALSSQNPKVQELAQKRIQLLESRGIKG